MLSANEIRQQFLDFFKSKNHHIVPSAPIVVKNDPTLLFTNAGMNQFKDYFLGNKQHPYPRIADTQKCLRVSGKHNDLEEVGVDTYHHTMFEMLGNWSFGDYFKEEAIAWSWELLTEVYKIPKDRLYVTVFEGDEKEKLPASDIALQAWKKLVADDHIVFGNKKDNFWEMGDIGPCGPSSEIHADLRSEEERAEIKGSELVNKDHPQVIEIWNNVFIQYNRKKDGSLENLPAKHVDTGMGLERLVRVMQWKQSNYDTDLFTGTIAETEKITARKYDFSDSKEAIAFRVIADHIRAIAFTIADGQLPSNTGAGYVIRRILRRAVRYYYSYLDCKQPLLFRLMPVLSKQFENVFPELHQQLDLVTRVVKEEEESFLRTLEKGLKKMDDIIVETAKQQTDIINGKAAFELFDTYGFPIDLTRLIASENNLKVDEPSFEEEMKQQKDRSRAATALDTDDWIVLKEGMNQFTGYERDEEMASVLKYRRVKGKGKELYQIVLDKTPFYAESGGQVGDTGTMHFGNETLEIIDTKKENDLIIHFAESIPDDASGEVKALINKETRRKTAMHHSATHLLHAALRKILGTHVAQKGSLVNAGYLRFDFSHFSKISEDEIAAIELLVNEKIRANITVVTKEMTKDEAVEMGAMALFGEKYGEKVRVVIMDETYSIELCGGTHIGATGELGFFKIKQETAVAAGIRRIEALTGEAAETFINTQLAALHAIKSSLKNPKDPQQAIEKLQEENAQLQKQLQSMEAQQMAALAKDLLPKQETINGVQFLGRLVEVTSPEALRKLCSDLKNQLPDHVIALGAAIGGKPFVAIGVAENLVAEKGLDAGKIIKEKIAPLIKGGGGGQKTMATAGGQNTEGLKQMIDAVKAMIAG